VIVSPERVDSMQQAWIKLLERYRVKAEHAYPVFDVLISAYTAPERHYHNLEHLSDMFRVAGKLAPSMDDPSAVQLAVWFHDAVYDPRAKDNEARSGELAVDLLGPIGVPASTIERVVRLVRSTTHLDSNDPPLDRDTAALLDADLAILGSAEERYTRYAGEIRKEYVWIPEEEYRKGRSGVLRKFMARPRIYNHPLMIEEGEMLARKNMALELEMLTK
jgi:predicted metal-dependent HD superfamily phosphohydrolase